MVAGLEGHIGRGPPGKLPRLLEGEDLGVGLSRPGVKPLAHDPAFPYQDHPHQGVRARVAPGPFGKLQGSTQKALVQIAQVALLLPSGLSPSAPEFHRVGPL